MEGGDPLQTLRPYLLSANVHVFAKMANKLRGKVGELKLYCFFFILCSTLFIVAVSFLSLFFRLIGR